VAPQPRRVAALAGKLLVHSHCPFQALAAIVVQQQVVLVVAAARSTDGWVVSAKVAVAAVEVERELDAGIVAAAAPDGRSRDWAVVAAVGVLMSAEEVAAVVVRHSRSLH
jgi:hypothetical protein